MKKWERKKLNKAHKKFLEAVLEEDSHVVVVAANALCWEVAEVLDGVK